MDDLSQNITEICILLVRHYAQTLDTVLYTTTEQVLQNNFNFNKWVRNKKEVLIRKSMSSKWQSRDRMAASWLTDEQKNKFNEH